MRVTVLLLVKADLGVTSEVRDQYFNALIDACRAELEGRGIVLGDKQPADAMLLADYAAWRYRARANAEMAMPRNLDMRIRNHATKTRASREVLP